MTNKVEDLSCDIKNKVFKNLTKITKIMVYFKI